MSRGGHRLPKVSLGPTLPNPSTPCRRPPLRRPDGHFRSGRLQGGWSAAVFYPLGHPTPYASAWHPSCRLLRTHLGSKLKIIYSKGLSVQCRSSNCFFTTVKLCLLSLPKVEVVVQVLLRTVDHVIDDDVALCNFCCIHAIVRNLLVIGCGDQDARCNAVQCSEK
jgi:hypothetical protein